MNEKTKQRALPAVSALAALLLFALCAVCVLLSGAGVYSRLVEDGAQSYARRTCVQFFSTKLRQSRSADHLAVEDFAGVPALVLDEGVEGGDYVTRVYCYDGWVRELFSARDAGLGPQDGEKLLPARSLTMELADGLLTLELTDETGTVIPMAFSPRGGKEASP